MKKLNPFLQSFTPVDIKVVTTSNSYAGEEYSTFTETVTSYSQVNFPVNTYFDSLPEITRIESFNLLMYIFKTLEEDVDYVEIDSSDLQFDVALAIEELSSINLIRKRSESLYWINPQYIFRGHRYTYLENKQAKHPELKLINYLNS